MKTDGARHEPRNVVKAHREQMQQASLNTRIAVWLTEHIGTMLCAYVFAVIGIGSLIGVFANNMFLTLLFGSVSSYFLQLVLLPILAVGNNVLSKHNELMAEEQLRTTQKSSHELATILTQLAAHQQLLSTLERQLVATEQHTLEILTLVDRPPTRKRSAS